MKEEYIEAQILEFLTLHKILVWHNDIKGFYDQKRGVFRRNKNNYIRSGISDIWGVLPWGRYLAIEVKTPTEMSFFDRPIDDLQERFVEAQMRNLSLSMLKKYSHAIEQRQYIDEVLDAGWVAFFASSIEEVMERMRGFDLEFV